MGVGDRRKIDDRVVWPIWCGSRVSECHSGRPGGSPIAAARSGTTSRDVARQPAIIREVTEFLVYLSIALILLAGLAVAGYFLLRRMFQRSADHVADRIGLTLTHLFAYAGATPAGARESAAAKAATGRLTNIGAYAAAKGIPEEAARRQFRDSIERTAWLMDAALRVPLLGRVGLDPVLGLFPIVGDMVAAAVAVSLIARSVRYGVPHEIIARMLGNVLVDLLMGSVPVAGNLADIWFKANMRNVALLREYLDEEARYTIDVEPVRAWSETPGNEP
jgi:hypothetical protein